MPARTPSALALGARQPCQQRCGHFIRPTQAGSPECKQASSLGKSRILREKLKPGHKWPGALLIAL
eukprot:1154273-Pelagomonas_calceolata.AAC.5